MGVYRMTPRPQMFMSSILRPAMGFLGTRNGFAGAALTAEQAIQYGFYSSKTTTSGHDTAIFSAFMSFFLQQ